MALAEAELLVKYPPERVWAAISIAGDWLPFGVAAWEVEPGGRIEVLLPGSAAVTGEVTAVEPGHRLAFTWTRTSWPAPTRVELTLEPAAGGTRIKLSHHQLRPDLKELYQRTWAVALERLHQDLQHR